MTKLNLEELDQLVSAAGGAPDLCSRVIERLVAMTSAKAGALWNCQRTPFLALAHHSVGQAARLGFSQTDHDRILAQVIQQQRSAVVTTKALDGTDAPTIFFAPLHGESKRVVELVFPANHLINSSREFQQELNLACERIGRMPLPDQPLISSGLPNAQVTDGDQTNGTAPDNRNAQAMPSLDAFSRYTHVLHSSLEQRTTCAHIANETRCLLDCDRVSVVLKQRGRYRIVAISGQPSVNRRSNTVQALERIASEVLKSKRELWYPNEEELAPQIQSILDQYLTMAPTRTLVVHPILTSSPAIAEDPELTNARSDIVIGGIVYEFTHRAWTHQEKSRELTLTTRHGGDALRSARQHRAIFLYPLWRWLGKSKWLSSPAALSKTLLATLVLIAVGLMLTLVRTDFYVSASGVLIPEHRQLVFPKTSGEVIQVAVVHGQSVQTDQQLLTLRSEDLELRIADVEGRLETLKQRRSALERAKFQASAPPTASANSVDENLNSLQAEIDSLERQAKHLADIEQHLQVTSPINGEVLTWDVSQKLTGRTVTPQNVLLEIADTSGNWQLELNLEDRRIEHVLRGLRASKDNKLLVKFTLIADPNQTYAGTISEVSQAVQLSPDHQQMMRIKVQIDKDLVPLKQARTGVAAKIYTGEETSLGYLWLHEIPRTLNRYVFFYFVR